MVSHDEAEELIAPDNFAMVSPGIYRSSFPKKKNFPFLKSLNLKIILTLVLEEYPEANAEFNKANGITLVQLGMPGNKEPFVDIPQEKMQEAVSVLLDTRNHPALIHCNKGKHRTGCLVGCLRKMCRWSLCSILDEYIRFSGAKARFMDQQFIELFDTTKVRLQLGYIPEWVPCSPDDLHFEEKQKQRQRDLKKKRQERQVVVTSSSPSSIEQNMPTL